DQALGEPASVRPRPVPRFAKGAWGEQLVEVASERITRVDPPVPAALAAAVRPATQTTRPALPGSAAAGPPAERSMPEPGSSSKMDPVTDRPATVVDQVTAPPPQAPVVAQAIARSDVTVTRLMPEVTVRNPPPLPVPYANAAPAAREPLEQAETTTVRITIG